jgi:hypothetical protein
VDIDAIPKQTGHVVFGPSCCSMSVLTPMNASIEKIFQLANLVLADGRTIMIAEGFDIFPMTAIALILILLGVRIMKRKHGGFLKSSRARGIFTNKRASGRLLKSQRSVVLKPCPNCAEQLPLSTIICPTCDYNFLAERPGRGQKLLPSPQPLTHEVPDQKSASLGL